MADTMFALLLSPLVAPLGGSLDAEALKGAMVAAYACTPDGREVYSRNADVRLMPASNQKLLSNAYAMHILGPDHRSETRFWRLPDRVVVDAPGDPTLTLADLVEVRKKLGIDQLLPVYVRQAYRPGVVPSWEFDDLPNRYAPRITAFTVDRGAFEPLAENGALVPIPEAYGVQVRLLPGTGKPMVRYDWIARTLTIRGTLPQERTSLETLSIPQPDEAAAAILGGPLLPTNRLPESAPDCVRPSPPLSQIVRDCLQPSDNLIAENLLLTAAGREGPLGDAPYDVAPSRLRTFLTDVVKLRRDSVRPFDGSGMSRHNLVTTRGVAELLRWIDRQPWASAFHDALPKPGSGTLRSRLSGVAVEAKTGTLDAVVSLSGYVRNESGRTIVFSVIVNHGIAPAQEQRDAVDAFVRELSRTRGDGMKLAACSAHAPRRPHVVADARPVAAAGHRIR